jgi:D-alanyl-D-alanine carboxypeptidase (penicillin-binding protein 5/6)
VSSSGSRARAALAAALAAVSALAATSAAAAPPPVVAPAYFVRSGVDGTVLAQRAASAPRAIASITKLMTVIVALEHLSLDDVVTVPRFATRIGEASVPLTAGERITVRELVEGCLIPSANDAATTLAWAAGGRSVATFVAWMNQKAADLGMRDTHFVTPHGLDRPGHVSSARDVVTLLRAALENPLIRRLAATAKADIRGREVETTDDLLSSFPPLVAGKTGHTDNAGWAEVAEARRGLITVYASVLGEPSEERRNDDLKALLAWGLARYRKVLAIDASRVYAVARTAYGRPPVHLVALRSVVREQLTGRPLVERIVAPTAVRLPVLRGTHLGEVRVYERGRLVASSPLVAAESIRRPGALGRVRWYATRTLHHLVSLVPFR